MTSTAPTPHERDVEILRARATTLAEPLVEASRATQEAVLTFAVGDERYGVPAEWVREVRPAPPLALLPHAPDVLIGVARIRSTVVPVFDLHRLLAMATSPADSARWVVVLEDGDQAPLGLAADAVQGVETLPTVLESPSEAIGAGGLVVGVTPGGLRLLDPAALLATPPPYLNASPSVPRTSGTAQDAVLDAVTNVETEPP